MIITKYVCDRCGKEIAGGTRRICIEDGSYNHISIPELKHADFCENCIKDMVILMTGKLASDPEPEPVMIQLDVQTDTNSDVQESRKKVLYLNKHMREEVIRRYTSGETEEEIAEAMGIYPYLVRKETKAIRKKTEPVITELTPEHEEEITRRYRNGEEMEAIADDMNCDLVVVSKFVDKQDLGKERYGQKKV